MKLKFTFLCFFLFYSNHVYAKVIYVDNQLADDCIGTYSIAKRDASGSNVDAYTTPQKAADVVQPGDMVYFREGIYYQHDDLRDAPRVMTVLRSGTVDKPITFKNYNNEKVILSAMRPNDDGHFYAVVLGELPSDQQVRSGRGIQNIIIDGLIIEGASACGLVIGGPADQEAPAENPTENVMIRNVIARNNSGLHSGGGGIATKGKVLHLTIEYCEAYNNTGTGIHFSRLSKSWHNLEPENNMSAAQYSTIKNCLIYNNISPDSPGNTDGTGGSHMYRCIIENNVVFNNSDDGMDIYASIEVTARNNIIFGQSCEGGNNAGLKCSAGGGGRHTISGNVIFNNDGYSFESSDPSNPLRVYYPSKIFCNIMCNGSVGISLGTSYTTTFAGYEKVYLRNNVAMDNSSNDVHGISAGLVDSDYNFIGNATNLRTLKNVGQDSHSITGEAGLVNKNAVIDVNFHNDWNVSEKLAYIRNQVWTNFSPAEGSQVIDKGTLIDGYHCTVPGEDVEEDGRKWDGTAPDIGAYEYGMDYPGPGPDPYQPDPGNPYINPDQDPTKTELQCFNNVIQPKKDDEAVIQIELNVHAKVEIVIYNSNGKIIKTLMDEEKQTGFYRMIWNGTDAAGNVVGSGIYMVHCAAGGYTGTKKIAVVK